MTDVLFKGCKIQTGFRIKIPKAIIDTLDIKENDDIVLKFNPEKKEINITLEKKKNS